MISFDVDYNNDLRMNDAGMLAIARGQKAVMNVAEHYARASRDEMIHKMDKGMPFWPVAFGQSANVAQYEAAFRARMREIPEVVQVQKFDARIQDNELQYEATISTIYGEAYMNSARGENAL